MWATYRVGEVIYAVPGCVIRLRAMFNYFKASRGFTGINGKVIQGPDTNGATAYRNIKANPNVGPVGARSGDVNHACTSAK